MNSVVTDIEDRKGQNMKITDGSFATFGTRRRAQNMEFTFAAKTESGDAAIRLYDLADKKRGLPHFPEGKETDRGRVFRDGGGLLLG